MKIVNKIKIKQVQDGILSIKIYSKSRPVFENFQHQ